MSEPVKLCINCKHIGRNGSGDAKRFRCFAVSNIKGSHIDLVTGDKVIEYYIDSCYEARREPCYCGPSGKWFEEKPPALHSSIDALSSNSKLSAVDLLKQFTSTTAK